MSDAQPTMTGQVFAWHPEYRDQTLESVRQQVQGNLGQDQRSYELALNGPEEQEQAMLVRVIELEKRWGPYAMDWAAADTGALADRIVAFEWEREQRRELFPFSQFRDAAAPLPVTMPPDDGGSDRPWWAFWQR